MMYFFNKNLLSGGMIIISLAIFFLFVQPRFSIISELRAKQSEYQKYLDDAHEVRIIRGTLVSKRDAVPPDIWAKLGKMVPSGFDETELLHSLGALASANGASLLGFESRDAAPRVPVATPGRSFESDFDQPPAAESVSAEGAGYHVIEFDIKMSVSYRNLITLLNELEKEIRLTDIIGLAIDSDDNSNGVYNVSVQARNYWVD